MTLDDLKMPCPICKSSGRVTRRTFASAGDMDVNTEPRMISQSCYGCHGQGWLWELSIDEMAERIVKAEGERDRQYEFNAGQIVKQAELESQIGALLVALREIENKKSAPPLVLQMIAQAALQAFEVSQEE